MCIPKNLLKKGENENRVRLFVFKLFIIRTTTRGCSFFQDVTNLLRAGSLYRLSGCQIAVFNVHLILSGHVELNLKGVFKGSFFQDVTTLLRAGSLYRLSGCQIAVFFVHLILSGQFDF